MPKRSLPNKFLDLKRLVRSKDKSRAWPSGHRNHLRDPFAILHFVYYPKPWEIFEIIMIHKCGKNQTQVASYRLTSLPTTSFKNHTISVGRKMIRQRQFGFLANHGTIELVLRSILEDRKYYSTVFLDVQTFDQMWHEGLILKTKKLLRVHFRGNSSIGT